MDNRGQTGRNVRIHTTWPSSLEEGANWLQMFNCKEWNQMMVLNHSEVFVCLKATVEDTLKKVISDGLVSHQRWQLPS